MGCCQSKKARNQSTSSATRREPVVNYSRNYYCRCPLYYFKPRHYPKGPPPSYEQTMKNKPSKLSAESIDPRIQNEKNQEREENKMKKQKEDKQVEKEKSVEQPIENEAETKPKENRDEDETPNPSPAPPTTASGPSASAAPEPVQNQQKSNSESKKKTRESSKPVSTLLISHNTSYFFSHHLVPRRHRCHLVARLLHLDVHLHHHRHVIVHHRHLAIDHLHIMDHLLQ